MDSISRDGITAPIGAGLALNFAPGNKAVALSLRNCIERQDA
jgi:hypothetical protein